MTVLSEIRPQGHRIIGGLFCAIAAENIWLEMEELGLGGVFMAVKPFEARVEFVTKVLNLPENIVPFGIMPFGYPKSKRPAKERFNADRVHCQ